MPVMGKDWPVLTDRRPGPVLLDTMIEKPRREIEMKSVWLVAVFGLVSALWFSWEPAPQVVTDPAVATGNITQAAPAQPVYPAGAPPGMVYDQEHNSWHYPAAVAPTSPHHP